jgi:hypothetical protein
MFIWYTKTLSTELPQNRLYSLENQGSLVTPLAAWRRQCRVENDDVDVEWNGNLVDFLRLLIAKYASNDG